MRALGTAQPARPLVGGRRRAAFRVSSALLAAAAALIALPQGASAALKMDATYALGGLVRPNAPAALEVIISSDRITAADLVVRVSTEQGPLVVSIPVEIPGGSKKAFRVVVPAASVDDVRLLKDGRVLGSTVPVRAGERTEETVGVLASEEPPLEHVRLEQVARDAEVVRVPQELLDLGSGALGPLTHLVVDAALARGFSPRQRETVLSFAANGGELVVAAARESDLAFLPAAWRGSGGGSVRRSAAGLGSATVAMASYGSAEWGENGALWTRTIRPYGRAALSNQTFEGSNWLNALAETGGLTTSRLAWLLTFVLGYVAVAGPVNFTVLARIRRRELAWVTIPALAVLFAGGAYAAGRGVRSGPVLQAAGIAVFDGSSDRTAASFGLMSRGGGEERLSLNGDWLMAPLSSPEFFGPFRATLPKLTPARDRSTATFDLPVGGVGTAVARRTRVRSSEPAGSLAWDGTAYNGTVKNPAPFALRETRVFVGTDRTVSGTLAPGEQAKVTVTPNGQPVEGIPEFFGFFRDGRPSVPMSLLSLAGAYAGFGQPGNAYLVGYAEMKEAAGPLGLPRGVGRVLVLARLGTTVAPGKPVPASLVRRSLLSTDLTFFEEGPGMLMLQGSRDAIFRFELPAGGTGGSGGALRLKVPDEFGAFGAFGKPIPVPLPPGAAPGVAVDQSFGRITVERGTRTIVVPVKPGVVVGGDVNAGQVDPTGQGVKLSLWNFATGKWIEQTVNQSVAIIQAADRTRFVREGQVLVRIHFGVPERGFRVSSLSLEEVA